MGKGIQVGDGLCSLHFYVFGSGHYCIHALFLLFPVCIYIPCSSSGIVAFFMKTSISFIFSLLYLIYQSNDLSGGEGGRKENGRRTVEKRIIQSNLEKEEENSSPSFHAHITILFLFIPHFTSSHWHASLHPFLHLPSLPKKFQWTTLKALLGRQTAFPCFLLPPSPIQSLTA